MAVTIRDLSPAEVLGIGIVRTRARFPTAYAVLRLADEAAIHMGAGAEKAAGVKADISELGGQQHAWCTPPHHLFMLNCRPCDERIDRSRCNTAGSQRSGPDLRSRPQGLSQLG